MHHARRLAIAALLILTSSVAMAIPSITSLSPTSGAVGATVTITGSGFGSPQGTSTVTFNGTPAGQASTWTTTSITIQVPTGATTGNVIVTVSGHASNGVLFTVVPPPSISGLTPSSGLVGTPVTISGSNFGTTQGTSTVQFNGTLAAPSSWSSSSISVPVPSGATTGNVIVHASGVNSNGVLFTVPPNITSLSPNAGAVGTSVVISGTNFGSSQGGVSFNGTAGGISSWSDTSITATVPAGATTGNVVVTAVGGAASSGVAFTVTGPPTISSLSPPSGAALSSVTITGANFGASQGNGGVTFNGLAASVTSWSDTSIVSSVPANATTGNVLVTAAGGVVSNGVSFTVTNPHINSLSATSGTAGTAITISGFNFGTAQGNSTVTFNGTLASPTSWSASAIVAPVPAGAASGLVVVSVAGEPSNGVNFTVITQPAITAVSPTSAAIGNLVTVTGSSFGATQGSSTITFNGVQATPNTWSATTIVAPVPSGATSGNVVVTADGQVSNGVPFTVSSTNGAPVISSISPTSGAAGTWITFTGSNFGATASDNLVLFSGATMPVGGESIIDQSSWTNTSFRAQVPSGAVTGPVYLEINGQPSNGVCFAVTSTTPCINTLSPTSGNSGTPVTISGINFGSRQAQGSTVTLNGATITVSSWSATSIVFSVPSTASSGNVVVTVGGIASNPVHFTIPGPVITNISPDSGRVGSPVTITGAGFGNTQGSSTLKFNGTTATQVTWSNTSLAANVPTGATTGPVVVTVGTQGSGGVTFTVTSAPSISSLSPASGSVNTMITVAGSGFGSPQGSSTISFNGKTATPFSWSDSAIQVPVPVGATTGPVIVTAGGTNSNASTFTVTPGPSITSLSATSGAAGSSVTITGSNFGTSQGSSAVRFNGLAATTSAWGTGSITATVPTGVTTGPVTVTVNGQTSNGITFTAITTGGLSGSVTNAVGGAAISGATVQLLQSGSVKATGTTNGAGAYSLSNVPSGSYDAQVSATGFGSALQSPLTITANQTATANFSLSAPGTISGNVTQSNGTTPISGASVQVLVGRATGSTATTDLNGAYTINGLNAGNYNVQASATGYVTKSQAVTLSGGASSTANFALQTPGNGAINYIYDELGRLVGVVDSSGDAATYTYDAVGNILSIGRLSSTQTSVINFTPASGLVGATVTINGTGFSATAGQNTVRFNGTSAVVTSSTTTQIVTTVPSGATTGPISVTTPSGSATSATSFTVNGSSGAPTITGFTPTSGLVGSLGIAGSGTAVTITGTNFDTAVANDKITFNITRADTKTATSGQLTTNVPPSTGSGRISLATPNGSAVSSQDFFIPFGGHATTDLGFTGRTTLGQAATVTLSTTNKIGELVFDGNAGQNFLLQMSGSTFASCTLYVFDPVGNIVAESQCTSGFTSIFPITLQISGTYTIGIDPAGGTGSITLAPATDVSTTITIDGPPVTVTTTVSGQDARLSFPASGQRIVVYATNVTNPAAYLNLVKPDGTTQGSAIFIDNNPSGQTFFMDTQALASGTYQLWVQHNGSNVGSETLQIVSVPADAAATLTVPAIGLTGPTSSLSTTSAGQNAVFSFSGTSGQKLIFNTTSTSYTNCNGSLVDPNNTVVTSINCTSITSGSVISLTATGTYRIIVDPQGTTTGSMSMSITNISDVPGTIAIDGAAVTTGTTLSGQDARLSFTATAGQRIVVYATSVTTPGAYLNLVKPDGTTQGSATFINNSPAGQTFFMDTQALATSGTYQLWIQHSGTSTGNETLQIASVPPDYTASLTAGVTALVPATGNLSVGQNAILTLNGNGGDDVSLQFSGNTIASVTVSLKDASGNTLTSTTSSAANFVVSAMLPATGAYTLLIDPVGTNTGSVSVLLTVGPSRPPAVRNPGSLPNPGNPLSQSLVGLFLMNEGSRTTDKNVVDGQVANFAGTTLPVWNTQDPSVALLGTTSSLSSYLDAGTDLSFDQLPTNKMTVAAKVFLNSVQAGGIAEKTDDSISGFTFGLDGTGALHVFVPRTGSAMHVATAAGAVTSGQWAQVAFTWDGTVATAASAHIYVNGVEQTKAVSTDGTGVPTYANATSRSFRIGNNSYSTTVGSLNGKMAYLAVYKYRVLTATELGQLDTQLPITTDVVGTTTENGTPTTVTTTTAGQNAHVSFQGWANQQVTVQLSNNTLGQVTVNLVAPDGSTVTSAASSAAAFNLSLATLPLTGVYDVFVQGSGTVGSITVGVVTKVGGRPSGVVIDPSSALSSNLVGLFLMNEGTGTTDRNYVDGQLATFSSGATPATPPVWNTADPSVTLLGTTSSLSSYLDAGTDLNFDQLPTNKMTVAAKVFLNSVQAGGIAEKTDDSISGFTFGLDGTGALHVFVPRTGSAMHVATAAGAVTSGQWAQVAFTWDGTVATAASAHIYVNGVEQTKTLSTDGTGVPTYTNATSRSFRIGNNSYTTTVGSLNGKMAYLAVYKYRVLTGTELGQLDTQLPITTDVVGTTTENGTPATVTTTAAGQNAHVSFQGWANQQVTVQLSNNTLGQVTVNLVAPDGSTVATTLSSAASFSLPTATLPLTGTYDVEAIPSAPTTGSITVTVTVNSDPRSPGSNVNRGLPLAQNLVGLFLMNEGTGTTDKNVVDGQVANFAGTTLPVWNTQDPSVALLGTTNSLSSYLDAGTDLNFDQLPTNKMTVAAKVFLNSVQAGGIAEKTDDSISGFTFGLDGTGALHVFVQKTGSAMHVATAAGAVTSGQWAQVAFTWDGTVATAASAHIYVNGVEQTKAVSTDGTGVPTYANATSRSFRIGNNSYTTTVGSLNGKMAYLAVYKYRVLTATELGQLDTQLPITTDVVGTTTENGTPTTVTTTAAGQNAHVSFQGWANQQVTVQLSNNTLGQVTVNLVAPDGSTVTSAASSAAAFNLSLATLPLTGVYDVFVQGSGTVGSITVGVVTKVGGRPSGVVIDPSSALSSNLVGLFLMNEGTGTTDKNYVDGQLATFSSGATPATPPVWNTADPSVALLGTTSSLSSYLDAGTDLNFDQLPTNKMTVAAKVFLNSVQAGGIAEKTDDSISGFTFGLDNTGALHVFVPKTGSAMHAATAAGAVTSGQWAQVAFTWDGTVATAASAHIYVNGVEQTKTLSTDGTGVPTYTNATSRSFRIGNNSYTTTVGSLDGKMAYLAVYKYRVLTSTELGQLDTQLPITTDVVGTTTENGTPATVTTMAGQNAHVSFQGWANQQVTVQLSNNTLGQVTVNLVAPDGSTVATTLSSAVSFSLPTATLPLNGTYDVEAIPSAPTTGSITIAVMVNSDPRSSGSNVDPSNALSTNLVGLFLMNEGTGTTDKNLVDGQVANFAGTNTPSWNTQDPSVVLSGTTTSLSSYLDAGADLNFDQLPTNKMTVAAKVFLNSVQAGGIAEKTDDSISGFTFGLDNTGALHVFVPRTGSAMHVATAAGAVTSGQWAQVAFTWDGTVATAASAHIYVNGVEQIKAVSTDGTGVPTYTGATNRSFRIGNNSYTTTVGSLDGKFAYMAVYRGRILSSTELTQLDNQLPIDTIDLSGSITPNGAASSETITTAGQNARLTFNATAGQNATVQLSSNTLGSTTVSLLNTDGTTLASVTSSTASFNLPPVILPNTGVYAVYVHPNAGTGSISVGLALASIPSRPAGAVLDSANPLSTSLTGLFVMNEGTGTFDTNLVDSQPANFSGTTVPTWNTTDPSVVFAGGGSLNSYLNAGTDLAFDQLPTSQVTIVARIFVSTLAAGGLCEKNDGNLLAGFSFGWDASGALRLTVEKSTADMFAVTPSSAIVAGQWMQVAFTWDGTLGTAAATHLYVNAIEQGKASSSDGSGSLTYANATNQPFRIANSAVGTSGSLNGKMVYLAVYRGRILTTTEMTQLDAQLPIH